MIGSLCCCCNGFYLSITFQNYTDRYESYASITRIEIMRDFDNFSYMPYVSTTLDNGGYLYSVKYLSNIWQDCPVIAELVGEPNFQARFQRGFFMPMTHFNSFSELKESLLIYFDELPNPLVYFYNDTHRYNFHYCHSSDDLLGLIEPILFNFIDDFMGGCLNA